MRVASAEVVRRRSSDTPCCIWKLITMLVIAKSVITAGMPVVSETIRQKLWAIARDIASSAMPVITALPGAYSSTSARR